MNIKDRGFRLACFYGQLEAVKYLLTSPDLEEHADIHELDNLSFRWACFYGHLEVVKYLLTSPELIAHANVHALNDWVFKTEAVNPAIQWVWDWRRADIEAKKLKKIVVMPGKINKGARL